MFLLLLGLTACQTGGRNNGAEAGADPSTNYVTLREGDMLAIKFEGATNLNTTAKIAADGTLPLPIIGKVKAAGRTPTELEAMLTVLYEKEIKANENISVDVLNSASVVYVSGAVLKPGKVPLDRPLTALDAVMEAGGFDPLKAKPAGAVVLRTENGRRAKYPVDLKKALAGDDLNLFYLKPFDIIYVPEKKFNL